MSTVGKIVVGTGLAAGFVKGCIETTGGNNQNSTSRNKSINQSTGNTGDTISQGNTSSGNNSGSGNNMSFTLPTYTMPADNTKVNTPIMPIRIDEKN